MALLKINQNTRGMERSRRLLFTGRASKPWQRKRKTTSSFWPGVAFMGAIALASYGLSFLLQTKYDLANSRTKQVEKEEFLKIKANATSKFNIQEAYWKLSQSGVISRPSPTGHNGDDDSWDMVRVPRPGDRK